MRQQGLYLHAVQTVHMDQEVLELQPVLNFQETQQSLVALVYRELPGRQEDQADLSTHINYSIHRQSVFTSRSVP